ncbi:helix-loop-helix DNA-binding domain-containing protein [Chlamydoabsidia padenii]|nr:helix-loop-helix DNA-binding domain-containing protein [Chlamydoabsidia padenii]
MNSSNQNINEEPSSKLGPKLKHPTAYHLQQQRLKYKNIDFAPSPLFLPAQQQQTNDSPHLSDIDYTELTSPLHTEYMPYADAPETRILTPTQGAQHYHHPGRRSMDQGYMYDNPSIDSAFAEQMRRAESNDDGLTRLAQPLSSSNQDFMFYSSNLDQRFKQFAVSAPVNINYSPATHHSPEPEEGGMVMMMGNPSSGDGGFDPRSESRSLENYEDDYAAQVNLQAMMDKRRRRRESHNAVERRRRDNINDRIQELGTLLPDNPDDGINRLNKGTILKKSVEQIKQLQQDLSYYRQRVQELESILKQMKSTSRH